MRGAIAAIVVLVLATGAWAGSPLVGQASVIDKPRNVQRSNPESIIGVQWSYGDGSYVYVKDGRVKSITWFER